jgi:hypothetical protein
MSNDLLMTDAQAITDDIAQGSASKVLMTSRHDKRAA